MPSQDAVAKLYDSLDFTHAFEAFVHTFQGVNMAAIREGFLSIDVHTSGPLSATSLQSHLAQLRLPTRAGGVERWLAGQGIGLAIYVTGMAFGFGGIQQITSSGSAAMNA